MSTVAKTYRPTKPIAIGAEAASYKGLGPDDEVCEIRVLQEAEIPAERWTWLLKQLAICREFRDTAVLPVLKISLRTDPRFLVLPYIPRQRYRRGEVTDDETFRQAMTTAHTLADVLHKAHVQGIFHGTLCPDAIFQEESGRLLLDLTGLDCGQTPSRAALVDSPWLAPELDVTAERGDFLADSYGIGRILCWLVSGSPSPDACTQLPITESHLDRFLALVRMLIRDEPSERPPMRSIKQTLVDLSSPSPPQDWATLDLGDSVRSAIEKTRWMPEQLGRFKILDKLGEGGMGAVYRAEDVTDGTIVALKVVLFEGTDTAAHQRFFKEARLLAEVDNPFVARIIEFNEDQGIHYLACEYVAGCSLADAMERSGKLPEPLAIAVVADVCRALADAHRKGIVHRDVKPDNILLVGPDRQDDLSAQYANYELRAKLTDFGLARKEEQTKSLALTQEGAIVGTPHYMSPEQAQGDTVGPASDVYSLGVTLFELLTGKPPYHGDTAFSIIMQHVHDPMPELRKLNSEVSEAAARIVERATHKAVTARYPDAESMLADLDRLQRGESTRIDLHPHLPVEDGGWVGTWKFTMELAASPKQLWPHVSNTERVNRAIGLPSIDFTTKVDPILGVQRFGATRLAGLMIRWQEHPFEWIEERRMGVLREFSSGPFRWFLSVVDMTPGTNGGTRLEQTIRIIPRGLIGRLVAWLEGGFKAPRALQRVYRRINETITLQAPDADPFESPRANRAPNRALIEVRTNRLLVLGMSEKVVDRLRQFLLEAPEQEVARIRPIAFAQRFHLDAEEVIETFLYAAREGLLVILWDILCPLCKIPSDIRDTLKSLGDHGSCPACNLDFQLDFANSVEMIFRAHPETREVETRTYCVGGPAHSPHVVAQSRLAAGETIEFPLMLVPGSYRLRSPNVPHPIDFRVRDKAVTRRWDHALANRHAPAPVLMAGSQVVRITNDLKHEAIVRIERIAPREDALTAAQASALAVFRQLFPGEVLSPGQLVSIAYITLLATRIDGSDRLYEESEAEAFARIQESFRIAERIIRDEGGAIVKTVGEGIVASFHEPIGAVRAGFALQSLLEDSLATSSLRVATAVGSGSAMVATINDRLDYFGRMVNQTARLLGMAKGGELMLPVELAAQPEIARMLGDRLLGMSPIASETFATAARFATVRDFPAGPTSHAPAEDDPIPAADPIPTVAYPT